MLILGIDDAGRGPLIGPMFLAGVLLTREQARELKNEGVADSKTLLHPSRIKLSGIIKDACVAYFIVKAEPREIDHAVISGVNLNTLEALKAAEIINELAKGRKQEIQVVIDCPSVNITAWKATLMQYLKNQSLEVVCEHKADANHPEVSAASILAKVAREDSIAELKKKHGEFGSGYPSDPITIEFLKKQGDKLKESGIFRKSWATWKALFPAKNQATLEDF
ncbi:ribonuclease HII [Candidatus Pacearchaeota archaeon]|nr:ribonuclease HII [Candidatus Pacearchaeota archaeon]